MDPAGAEERTEPIINPLVDVTDEERGEAGAGDLGVVERGGAGEGLSDSEVSGAEILAGIQQLQETERIAKERLYKLRTADKAVFGGTERELKKHDERERLLAENYRDSERQREEVAKARCRIGVNTIYKPLVDDDQSCYIEIKNLVFIESSVIHKKALEEWDRKEKLFAARVERKSSKVESLKNEVYQLIGFFSVFQGVIFTAVAQANLLHCNNLWSPVLLSGLASVVTIAGVAQKLMQISALEKTIYSEELALKDVFHRGQELRREGKKFVFAKFSEDKKKISKKGYFGWYALGVLTFLAVFTLAFPLSHWRILCHST